MASQAFSGAANPNGVVVGNPGDTYQDQTGKFWINITAPSTWVQLGSSSGGGHDLIVFRPNLDPEPPLFVDTWSDVLAFFTARAGAPATLYVDASGYSGNVIPATEVTSGILNNATVRGIPNSNLQQWELGDIQLVGIVDFGPNLVWNYQGPSVLMEIITTDEALTFRNTTFQSTGGGTVFRFVGIANHLNVYQSEFAANPGSSIFTLPGGLFFLNIFDKSSFDENVFATTAGATLQVYSEYPEVFPRNQVNFLSGTSVIEFVARDNVTLVTSTFQDEDFDLNVGSFHRVTSSGGASPPVVGTLPDLQNVNPGARVTVAHIGGNGEIQIVPSTGNFIFGFGSPFTMTENQCVTFVADRNPNPSQSPDRWFVEREANHGLDRMTHIDRLVPGFSGTLSLHQINLVSTTGSTTIPLPDPATSETCSVLVKYVSQTGGEDVLTINVITGDNIDNSLTFIMALNDAVTFYSVGDRWLVTSRYKAA
jgi:hypothetical protein